MSNDDHERAEVPDPNGPPRPVKREFSVSGCLAPVFAGGGLFMLLTYTMLPCVGATRSAKLQWQRRQELIDLASQDEQRQESLAAETDVRATDDE